MVLGEISSRILAGRGSELLKIVKFSFFRSFFSKAYLNIKHNN